MIVDLVLGAIFITAIICFTVYKINKNSGNKKGSYFENDEEENVNLRDESENNNTAIGFQFKRDAKTLRKEEKKNGKKR